MTTSSRQLQRRRTARGATMVEILVALVITLIGLFAMLGLNLRSFQAESESYQRSQALVLADDMAQRIRANRTNAAAYATPAATAAGGGPVVACPAASSPSAATDLCEWGNLLRGAAEVTSSGSNIGAMSDARGCIAVAAPASAASSARVVVIWRGTVATDTNAAAPCVPPGSFPP